MHWVIAAIGAYYALQTAYRYCSYFRKPLWITSIHSTGTHPHTTHHVVARDGTHYVLADSVAPDRVQLNRSYMAIGYGISVTAIDCVPIITQLQ